MKKKDLSDETIKSTITALVNENILELVDGTNSYKLTNQGVDKVYSLMREFFAQTLLDNNLVATELGPKGFDKALLAFTMMALKDPSDPIVVLIRHYNGMEIFS